MSLPKNHKENFRALTSAAKNGDLALMECQEAESGKVRAVLCAVAFDGTDYVFTPFGHLCDEDPYTFYLPPDPKGGFV